jgi:AraC-like DNA-binding protein
MNRLRRVDVFVDDAFPLGAARYVLSGDVEPHTHDFVELAVVLAGTPTYLDESGEHVLGPGAVAVVRPGQWHGYSRAAQAEVINLYLGAELIQRELAWLLDVPDLARFLIRGGVSVGCLAEQERAVVSTAITALSAVRVEHGTPPAVTALGLTYQALGAVAATELSGSGPAGAVSPAVRAMLAAMADGPDAEWTMADLARLTGHSVSHLHREFKAQLGISPLAWLSRSRGELAAVALIQTDEPVAEIGRGVGWPDPNYFSRVFRRRYGTSPTAYRRRYR